MKKVSKTYTTAEKKAGDIKERDKVELSNDAYAICEFLENLTRSFELKRTGRW